MTWWPVHGERHAEDSAFPSVKSQLRCGPRSVRIQMYAERACRGQVTKLPLS